MNFNWKSQCRQQASTPGKKVYEEQVWMNGSVGGESRLDANREHEGQGKHKGKDKTATNKLADQ